MGVRPVRLRRLGRTAVARTALAGKLVMSGHESRALTELDAALHENPELAAASALRGLILLQRADHEGAIRCLSLAVLLDDKLQMGWVGLAQAHRAWGDPDSALSAADRAVELDETSSSSHLLRGILLSELGRRGEAHEAFRTAVRNDPNSAAARHHLALALAESGRNDEALQEVSAGDLRNPLATQNRVLMGDLRRDRGDIQAALNDYVDVAFSRFSVDALTRAAELMAERGLLSEALRLLRMALTLEPERVDTYLSIARIYIQQQRHREAHAMCRAAQVVRPDSQEIVAMMEQVSVREDESQRTKASEAEPGRTAP